MASAQREPGGHGTSKTIRTQRGCQDPEVTVTRSTREHHHRASERGVTSQRTTKDRIGDKRDRKSIDQENAEPHQRSKANKPDSTPRK